MIAQILLVATAAWILFKAFTAYTALQRNIAEAQKSGLPYVLAPLYFFSRLWMTFNRPVLRLLEKTLPHSWQGYWMRVARLDWIWYTPRKPYMDLGSDTFLVVSPRRILVWTCDADVLTQITTRKTEFPKPTKLYAAVNVYGSNLVSTEGATWRLHRKVTAPPFNEKNNRLVWDESIHQANAMIDHWNAEGRNGAAAIHTIADDTMKATLHIISRAGFGVPLLWPHEEAEAAAKGIIGQSSSAIPPGHTMSFRDSLATVLNNLIIVIVFPKWLMRNIPSKTFKLAHEAYIEWGKYMQQMVDDKRAELRSGKTTGGFDLAGNFVRAATENEKTGGDDTTTDVGRKLLSDDELMGNMFVMLLAGHETTGNTLHFSLVYLAMHTASQRRLQEDIDQRFGRRDPSEWTYDEDIPKLFGGMVGAVMNEELRLIPPANGVPKCTLAGQPQTINVNGKRCVIPAESLITLDLVGLHRNPRYWPSQTPDAGPLDRHNDLNTFRPERWLLKEQSATTSVNGAATATNEDLSHEGGADTSVSLYKPPRGAYAPFSDGARSCLGRRFAQVEALVILAVIFRDYSVELALDDFAGDEELARMSTAQRKEVWQKGVDRVHEYFGSKMMTAITLQMKGAHVPIRLVKRGHERCFFD